MREIVRYIIDNLPKVEPQGNHEDVEELEFVVENDNIFAQFKVEVQTLIDDLFLGDYSSPSEYTSRLIIQDPEIEFLLLDNKKFSLTPHEWKEVKKAIIHNIDTHGYDDVQN